ncbi:hypothetical protein AUC31_17345 [Planococcus rifietoensis]|uniref:Excalibur calcium-binding domain-containing protein n=1 Tax=Planococcus rifietoensis TaxID=200991 RepID=A0A0U2ZCE8_9BACL|nr:excalibur calcium-binding domain-containing protein [Planococcus rifietoensis]ALS76876.1 hypothetical protein AUC31_17345 [Planococcus rifietoensis]
MIEALVIFILFLLAIFLFVSFYEIILIIIGVLIFGWGLERNNNSAKNLISIFGALVLFTGIGMLFVDSDEPNQAEDVVQTEPQIKEDIEETKEIEPVTAVETPPSEEAEEVLVEEPDEPEEPTDEASSAPKMECVDFNSHEELLEYWYGNGYSADNDPHNLDEDANGIPCDSEDLINQVGSPEQSNSSVYYDNCAAVRSAGVAPIRTDDAGYGSHLDRDGDGIACEPY